MFWLLPGTAMVSQQPLWQKLQFPDGMRVRLANAPEGTTNWLGGLPTEARRLDESAGKRDAVLVFIASQAERGGTAKEAVRRIPENRPLRVTDPKKSCGIRTDIPRDQGWEPLANRGLQPLCAVSANGTWSALQFRPLTAVSGAHQALEPHHG